MHRIRVLRPAPGIYAFYDGRIEGYRFGEGPNWVDQGAISLGVASYALVSGSEAIVYDTLVSVEHGRFIRATLEDIGVRSFTVVLSHWHLDHVAGNAAFGDCEIIASERTGELLAPKKARDRERGAGRAACDRSVGPADPIWSSARACGSSQSAPRGPCGACPAIGA